MSLLVDNLIIPQGSTYSRVYPVSGSDMTGASVKAQIRSVPGSSEVLYELQTDLVLNVDPTTASVTILISADDSWNFTWHQAYYDIVLTLDDGTKSRLVQGYMTLDLGVTHE